MQIAELKVQPGQFLTETVSSYAEIKTCPNTGDKSLCASKEIAAGEIIEYLGAKQTLSEPNYLTVQIGDREHILLQPEFLQYINHSCQPNVRFDLERKVVRALRNIKAGEEFTFFYPSTEWSMDRPFTCLCQSDNCLQRIAGAAYIPLKILGGYDLSAYIRRKAGL